MTFRTSRTAAAGAVLSAVLAVALSACGGGTTATSAAPAASAAATDPAAAKTEVKAAYEAYSKSLVDRDFATTCAALTPEAAAKIPAAIEQNNGPKGQTCEQAFAFIYNVPEAAEKLDSGSKGITVGDINVTGDNATIAFKTASGGSGSANAVRQNGKWLIAS